MKSPLEKCAEPMSPEEMMGENMAETNDAHMNDLQTRAERLLKDDPTLAAHPDVPDLKRLLHELHVHQIELQLQNDELLQARDDLQTLHQEYFDLYNLSPVGYIVLDRDGTILKANLAATHALGLKGAPGFPLTLSAFVDPKGIDGYYQHLGLVRESGQKQVLECGMRSRTRPPFFARLETVPVFDKKEKGTFYRLLTALTDITELKDAQKVLEQHRDLLRKEVKEQTGKLETAVVELRGANQDLQDFSYAASHDLQEPLRKIQMFGSMLAKGLGDRLTDTERDYLQRMQNAAGRMQEMINSLLGYSRVAAKAGAPTAVDLNDSVRRALDNLSAVVETKKAQVRAARLPTLCADPVQMVQVFQNLIGNALKFCEQKPRIDIHAEKNGAYQNIYVTDNGIGFDEKYLDRIFAPFERLHGHGTYEGTGIGLAVCRKIVERHGGTITAHSAPGKGATFIVTLPDGSCVGQCPVRKSLWPAE